MEQLVEERDMVKVFKAQHFELGPPAVRDMFVPRSAVSQRDTRASDAGQLHLSRCRLEQTQRSFRYRAAVAWNRLPKNATSSVSVATFKRAIGTLRL